MEKYIKAMRGELDEKTLFTISSITVPHGEYAYDYERMRSVLLGKLNGKFSDEYIRHWLVLVSNALYDQIKYEGIAWVLDGHSFDDTFDRKTVLKILSDLKDMDYKLKNSDYLAQHEKDGLKVVYLRLNHCNRTANSCVFKAYFVDYKTKRFYIRMVDDGFFEYDDNILYCDISSAQTIITEQGEEELLEPHETWQEEKLMSKFFSGDDWVCDYNLKF